MTLEENEEQIYNELFKNRCKLYSNLSGKINIDTNNYFSLNKNTFVYEPTLDSSLEVIRQYSNDNYLTDHGNGVVSLKGAVLKEGWPNCGLWEMSVDVCYPNQMRYTGLILLADADNPFPDPYDTFGGWGIKNWEGKVTGTPCVWDGEHTVTGHYTKTPDTLLSDGHWSQSTPWYTLHVKKTSSTGLEVWKNNDIVNKVIYNWEELSDVSKVTFGAVTNAGEDASSYDSTYIRNFIVTYSTPTDSITQLCEKTKKIKCNTNNVATVPPAPTLSSATSLAAREWNIHNKIQYCNNVLRYTLRKCGIEFDDSYDNNGNYTGINSMQELIKYINEILTTSTIDIDNIYSAYVNPVQLTSNKSTVQTGDSYNLITEVIDGGAGIEVDLFRRNLETNTDEYIETISTNANGIASFPLISDGKGLETYYAKVNNLASNDLEVFNYIMYDEAITDSEKWFNYGNRITISRDVNGTLLKNVSSSSSAYLIVNKDKQSVSDGTVSLLNEFDNFIMKFNVVSVVGKLAIYLRGSSGTYTKSYSSTSLSNVNQITVVAIPSCFLIYLDDTLTNLISRSDELLRIGFQINQGWEAKIKNFLLYSINGTEPYENCLFYDGGTTNFANSNYENSSAISNVSVTDNGTIYEVGHSLTTNYLRKTVTSFTGDFEAVVYVDSPDHNARFGVTSSSDKIYCIKKFTGYLKLVRENNVTSAYFSTNGSNWTNMSLTGTEPSTDTVNVWIGIYNNTDETWSLTYRDLKVYKI